MISYDKRRYYHPNREPFSDPEWEDAERADEKPAYYWVYWEGSKALYIKKYKPSVMALVKKRTGCEYYRVIGGEK